MIEDKVKEIQNLEKKQKKLKIDYNLVSEDSKRKKIEEQIKKTSENIKEEQEKVANSRVKVITMRLRENSDDDTIAHEFTTPFLFIIIVPKDIMVKKMKLEQILFCFIV